MEAAGQREIVMLVPTDARKGYFERLKVDGRQ